MAEGMKTVEKCYGWHRTEMVLRTWRPKVDSDMARKEEDILDFD